MQTAAPGPGEAKHMPVFGLGRDTSGRDDNHNERLYGGRESKDSSIAALEAFQVCSGYSIYLALKHIFLEKYLISSSYITAMFM